MLNVRGRNADVVSVDLASEVRFTSAVGRTRIVFIHGFANAPIDAHESYGRLRRKVEAVVVPHQLEDLGSVWEFHWPGNHPTGGKAMDLASYSARVGFADESGAKLGALLSSLDSTSRVVLVAHSMGCRVALSAIRHLIDTDIRSGSSTAPEIAAFLMAAAVPVDMCISDPEQARLGDESIYDWHERFNDSPRFSWRRDGVSYIVFHSRRDEALTVGFPFGQLFVEKTSEAVGRRGGPVTSSGVSARWDDTVRTKHLHGAYWSSERVASRIADSFPCSHRHRSLPSEATGPEERQLAECALPTRPSF